MFFITDVAEAVVKCEGTRRASARTASKYYFGVISSPLSWLPIPVWACPGKIETSESNSVVDRIILPDQWVCCPFIFRFVLVGWCWYFVFFANLRKKAVIQLLSISKLIIINLVVARCSQRMSARLIMSFEVYDTASKLAHATDIIRCTANLAF